MRNSPNFGFGNELHKADTIFRLMLSNGDMLERWQISGRSVRFATVLFATIILC